MHFEDEKELGYHFFRYFIAVPSPLAISTAVEFYPLFMRLCYFRWNDK